MSNAELTTSQIILPITGIGAQLASEYGAVLDYAEANAELSFISFDYATSHSLALCTFFRSTELLWAERLIRDIDSKLKFLLNIFKRPLIHLKEADLVQSIDAVKRVTFNSLRHLSQHTENVESVENNRVKPARLMTKIYEDDYGIYENIVFRDFIDRSLSFLREATYYLGEITGMFKQLVHIDVATRFNHSQHYLAIGKLYAGFSVSEEGSNLAELLKLAENLYRCLSANKTKPVYAKNKRVKPLVGKVNKTNILSMHKDYKHVYNLCKRFEAKSFVLPNINLRKEQEAGQRSYGKFCELLFLFAASTFSFTCLPSSAVYSLGKLDVRLSYKKWSVAAETHYSDVLGFDTISVKVFCGTSVYNILLVPMGYYIVKDKKKRYEHIVTVLRDSGQEFDKCVFMEPFFLAADSFYTYSEKCAKLEEELFYAVLPISISEVNSFRRIQQLLLEGMIKTDSSHTMCAFCGSSLVTDAANYLCLKCRTAIYTITCARCATSFTATTVDAKKNGDFLAEPVTGELPDFYKQEKRYLFRATTNTVKDSFVCPHCGELHGLPVR